MQISLQIGSFGLEQNFNVYVFRKIQLRFFVLCNAMLRKKYNSPHISIALPSHYHRTQMLV